MRLLSLVSVLALGVAGSLAAPFTYADPGITVTPNNPKIFRKVIASIEPPTAEEGTKVFYEWDTGKGVEYEVTDGGLRVRLWPEPGTHEITCRCTSINFQAETFHSFTFKKSFTVSGQAPIPPPPTPQRTLCELAGKDAPALRSIYVGQRSILETLDNISFKTYMAAHESQLKRKSLQNNGAKSVIDQRFYSSVDDPHDKVMTSGQHSSLMATLAALIAELDCGPGPIPPGPDPPTPPIPPIPPTPEQGERIVIIVNETTNTPPAIAMLLNSLRTDQQAEYLSSKGHRLYVLDPEAKDVSGNPDPMLTEAKIDVNFNHLPAVFILDSKTRKLLNSVPLPNAADKVIDFLKANGG